ncbi:thermonuclease family protein [Dehalococcoidia bacterium]|nr:thermonuclease family protein [Dehalococcoidia bacterium]MCL0078903.1 thermonuclease family protein [Dehalococcoidia bacterium]
MEPSYRYRAEVGRVVDGDTRIEARTYVEKRLAQNGNRMLVETGKRGKWRRWIATIYLPDSPKSLNEELIENGLARRVEEV